MAPYCVHDVSGRWHISVTHVNMMVGVRHECSHGTGVIICEGRRSCFKC